MHYTEIDHQAKVSDAIADLDEDDRYGYRPVLLEGFVMVDGTDVLVPAEDNPESMIVALTEDQAVQALLVLAEQVGNNRALDLIGKQSDHDRTGK